VQGLHRIIAVLVEMNTEWLSGSLCRNVSTETPENTSTCSCICSVFVSI